MISQQQNDHLPSVYDQYSSRDLLVMEYMHGKKVSEVIEEKEPRFDQKKLNRNKADFIMSQLLINGYFHADPHPGNFLILEGNYICYIDFGMVYSLRPYELENLNYMMLGSARLDPSLVARSLLRMGNAEGKVENDIFVAVVHDYIETHLNKPLEYIDASFELSSVPTGLPIKFSTPASTGRKSCSKPLISLLSCAGL
ncbi:MAG: AarF/UbiB family protein [Spirochaetia bacterium]